VTTRSTDTEDLVHTHDAQHSPYRLHSRDASTTTEQAPTLHTTESHVKTSPTLLTPRDGSTTEPRSDVWAQTSLPFTQSVVSVGTFPVLLSPVEVNLPRQSISCESTGTSPILHQLDNCVAESRPRPTCSSFSTQTEIQLVDMGTSVDDVYMVRSQDSLHTISERTTSQRGISRSMQPPESHSDPSDSPGETHFINHVDSRERSPIRSRRSTDRGPEGSDEASSYPRGIAFAPDVLIISQ